MLKLEHDKWYVGISTNVERRYLQHRKGFAGAAWTHEHKPIKIHYVEDLGVVELDRAQLYEGRVTRKYMEKYGDNNVRGGDLLDTEEYVRRFDRLFLLDDWRALTTIILLFLIIVAQGILYYLK